MLVSIVLFGLMLLWLLTLFAHISALFDFFYGRNLLLSQKPPKNTVVTWIHYYGDSAFLFFMASTSATLLIFVERFRELSLWAEKSLGQIQHAIDRSKVDITREIITQTLRGGRLVDVEHELQIEVLYRDASHLCAYFPVHTVLRDTPGLRTVLAETMAHDAFKSYDMIVGPKGYHNLCETFDVWCSQIVALEKRGDLGRSKTELENLNVFVSKLKVKFDNKVDEVKCIRLSFFYVTLSDPAKQRGIIYVWAEPFGYNFEEISGALILEADSRYLNSLYGIFAKAWGAPSAKLIGPNELKKSVAEKLQKLRAAQ